MIYSPVLIILGCFFSFYKEGHFEKYFGKQKLLMIFYNFCGKENKKVLKSSWEEKTF